MAAANEEGKPFTLSHKKLYMMEIIRLKGILS
jgi:hypothetical protein